MIVTTAYLFRVLVADALVEVTEKAGVQKCLCFLDSGFRRNDETARFRTFCEFALLRNC